VTSRRGDYCLASLKTATLEGLRNRATWLFATWAPAAMECDGDFAREAAVLGWPHAGPVPARPGVAIARAEYDDVLAELARRARRSGERARRGEPLALALLDAAPLSGRDFFSP